MSKVFIVATAHESRTEAQDEIRKLDPTSRFENLGGSHPVFWVRTILPRKDLEAIGPVVQVYDSIRDPERFPVHVKGVHVKRD